MSRPSTTTTITDRQAVEAVQAFGAAVAAAYDVAEKRLTKQPNIGAMNAVLRHRDEALVRAANQLAVALGYIGYEVAG